MCSSDLEINKELEQVQKVIVLIRLLELIDSSDQISEQELEFATTVANAFNIPFNEYENLKSFIEKKSISAMDLEHLLFINSRSDSGLKIARHFRCEQFSPEAEVIVMKLSNVNMFVLKLFGKMELLLNGQTLYPERIYIFNPGSSLKSAKVKPICPDMYVLLSTGICYAK